VRTTRGRAGMAWNASWRSGHDVEGKASVLGQAIGGLTGRRHWSGLPIAPCWQPYPIHPAMKAPMPRKNWKVAVSRPRLDGCAIGQPGPS